MSSESNCELSVNFTHIKPDEKFLEAFTQYLKGLISNRDDEKKNLFSNGRIPKISLEKYIDRILSFISLSENELLNCTIYMKRISKKYENRLTDYNIHNLMISIKFLRDIPKKNEFFAKTGGFKNNELLEYELKFLEEINYELFVDLNEIAKTKIKMFKGSYNRNDCSYV